MNRGDNTASNYDSKGCEDMNKRVMMIIGTITILGAGTVFTSIASAQTTDTQTPMTTLVQKIADKFNLNKEEVQKVFDEHRDEMQQKRQTKMDERLSELVKDGKLTNEQKTLILNKIKELQDKRESEKDSLRNLTPEERKSKMEAARTDLQNWAKDNGIDLKYLWGGFGGHRFGHGGMMHNGPESN